AEAGADGEEPRARPAAGGALHRRGRRAGEVQGRLSCPGGREPALRRLQHGARGRAPQARRRGQRAGRAAVQGRGPGGLMPTARGPVLSRRGLLGGAAGLGIVGAAGAGLAGCGSRHGAPGGQVVPFHGAHQAGIVTDVHDRLAFAAFDVTTTRREDLVDMLRTWTAAGGAMTRRAPVPGDSSSAEMPPADTGETVGMPPSRLTVTIGFGPSLFDQRFGLGPRRPTEFADLPALPGEIL